MEIEKDLYKEIKEYCDLNGLKPREYIHDLLKKAFVADKYGPVPHFFNRRQIAENDKKFDEFIEKVGGEKYAEAVNEALYGDDNSTKNEVPKPPEPVPDTDTPTPVVKVEQTEEKPQQQIKKRTIKPIK